MDGNTNGREGDDEARLSDERVRELAKRIPEVFRPGTPIRTDDVFSGRKEQLVQIQDTVACPGMHAVVFGERGVGKTSLAELCNRIYRGREILSVKVTCSPTDTFRRIWELTLKEFELAAEQLPHDVRTDLTTAIERAREELAGGEVDPYRARYALLHIARIVQVVVFFDEFDLLEDENCLILFSNTIKQLSDSAERIVLISVGVGESVKALIAEHQSVERCLNQIRMPRMGQDAIEGIITSGFSALGMGIDDHSKTLIHFVSRGLPHYTHLLCLEAARWAAVTCGRGSVTKSDTEEGLRVGMAKRLHSLTEEYERALNTANRSNHADVLYACSIVSFGDRDGYFSPSSIREYYSKIVKQPRTISQFNSNLVSLSGERAKILERRGAKRSWEYRFSNSLMGPFVIMRGILGGEDRPGLVQPGRGEFFSHLRCL